MFSHWPLRQEFPEGRRRLVRLGFGLGGSGLDNFMLLSAYTEHMPRNLRSTPNESHMLCIFLPLLSCMPPPRPGRGCKTASGVPKKPISGPQQIPHPIAQRGFDISSLQASTSSERHALHVKGVPFPDLLPRRLYCARNTTRLPLLGLVSDM